jgi:hypothetical protein
VAVKVKVAVAKVGGATVNVGVRRIVQVGDEVGTAVSVRVLRGVSVGVRVIGALVSEALGSGLRVGLTTRLGVREGLGLNERVAVGRADRVTVGVADLSSVAVREGVWLGSGPCWVGENVGLGVRVLVPEGDAVGDTGTALQVGLGVRSGTLPTRRTIHCGGPTRPETSRTRAISMVSPRGNALVDVTGMQNCTVARSRETKRGNPNSSTVHDLPTFGFAVAPHAQSAAMSRIVLFSSRRNPETPGTPPSQIRELPSPVPREA